MSKVGYRRGIVCLGVLLLGGCTVTKIPPLPPLERDPAAPLQSVCLAMDQVTDERSNKAVSVEGAFNFIGIKAEEDQLHALVAGEFREAAASRGADVANPSCLNHLNVAIRGFVWGQAWGWPVTAHRCVVAFDANLRAGDATVRRRLESERTTRNSWGKNSNRGEGVADCLKEQLREVAGSFFDDGEVRAALKR